VEERGLTPLSEQAFGLHRMPTLGESPQRKRLPGLCHFDFSRKKGGGRKFPTAQQQHHRLRWTPLLQKAPMPVAFLAKARVRPAVRTSQRNQAPTAGSPPEQLASERSLSPSFSPGSRERHPSPPGFGAAEATFGAAAVDSPRRGRLVSRGRVRAAHGGQGRGRQRVAGQPCLSARGGVGDGSNLALEQRAHRPFHSAPPGR